ncbi:MAG TPA: hypothetical protein VJH24_01765 [Candidatus Bilamarchaeaceae archaeon]|nr:hypothetical protein [Candidatus Bilamarchaeaceae archaeon]
MENKNEQTYPKLPLTLAQLQEMGFENEQEYHLYLYLKKSLQQKVPIGIAS